MLVPLKNGVYRNGRNRRVEEFKKTLNLDGDVYIVNHTMHSLKSHRALFFDSEANNIVEAYNEYISKYKGKENEYV